MFQHALACRLGVAVATRASRQHTIWEDDESLLPLLLLLLELLLLEEEGEGLLLVLSWKLTPVGIVPVCPFAWMTPNAVTCAHMPACSTALRMLPSSARLPCTLPVCPQAKGRELIEVDSPNQPILTRHVQMHHSLSSLNHIAPLLRHVGATQRACLDIAWLAGGHAAGAAIFA